MTTAQPPTRVLQAPESLGLATREAFRHSANALLNEMSEGTGQLVVDLGATRQVDSSGLGALVMVQRHASDRRQQVVALYMDGQDELKPVTIKDLRRLMRTGDVTVLDVRPTEEYNAAHIPGALSVPVSELKRRLREIPKGREVVAYCRGPYCIYSLEAVTLLRKSGYRARRAEEGLPTGRPPACRSRSAPGTAW